MVIAVSCEHADDRERCFINHDPGPTVLITVKHSHTIRFYKLQLIHTKYAL